MSGTALLVVLCSVFLHAGWNTLLARAVDSRAATNLALLVGALALLPAAVATWDVSARVIPYAAASALLEVVYVFLLGAAYHHGQLSLVYPIARGASPVGVLALSHLVGGHPGWVGALGATLVGLGVLAMRGIDRRGMAFGLALGVVLALITTVDSFGVDHAATLPYLFVVIAPAAVTAVLLDHRRGRVSALRDELRLSTLVAGLGFVGTYSLILYALTLAPATAVAAVRELSIVVAVVLGALFLREPVTRRRLAAACIVTAGAALAAAGA